MGKKYKYGRDHRRLREALIIELFEEAEATGEIPICIHCGYEMRSDQSLDLDHTSDGLDYRGIVHSSCNRSEGAKRGNQMRNRKNTRRW